MTYAFNCRSRVTQITIPYGEGTGVGVLSA